MFTYEMKLIKKDEIKGVKTKKEAKDLICRKILKDNAFETNIALAFGANEPIGYTILSIGDTVAAQANIKGLIGFVGLTQAESIILMHNHPFGGFKPSKADIFVYFKVKRVLETIGVDLEAMYIVSNGKRKNILDWYDTAQLDQVFKQAKKMFWWNF